MGKILEVFAGRRDASSVYGLNFVAGGQAATLEGGTAPSTSGGQLSPAERQAFESQKALDEQELLERQRRQDEQDAFSDLVKGKQDEFLNAQFEGIKGGSEASANARLNAARSGLGGLSTGIGGEDGIRDQLGDINSPKDYTAFLGGLGTGIDSRRNALENISKGGLGQAQGGTGSIADLLQARGMGEADPRFEAVRQAQLDQLSSQQQSQQTAQDEFFGRRGLGGSAAALNAQNKLSDKFGQQQQSLTSNIGLQSLQRGDSSLNQALAARGQQGQLGLAGAQFDQSRIGLQAQLGLQDAQFRQGIAGQQFGQQLQGAQFQQGRLGQQAQLGLADAQFQQGNIGQQAALGQQVFGNQQAGAESRNAAQNQRLQALTAGLTTAGAPLALQISQEAAQRETGGGGSGGKK